MTLRRRLAQPRGSWCATGPGSTNGLDRQSAVSLDDVQTILASDLREQVGWLLPAQEAALTAALHAAYDLDDL